MEQTQDSIENFCGKIRAGKKAQKTRDFMICARIKSLILERGMDDALERAGAFVAAGADAIMIHSRRKEPTKIFEFIEKFRARDKDTPVVLVLTSFNTVTEEEFKERGAKHCHLREPADAHQFPGNAGCGQDGPRKPQGKRVR